MTDPITIPETGSLDGKNDPESQNANRAAWAGLAIDAFQNITCSDDNDALADLLCDLMHWCDRKGESFRLELQRAAMHYEAETTTG